MRTVEVVWEDGERDCIFLRKDFDLIGFFEKKLEKNKMKGKRRNFVFFNEKIGFFQRI